MMFKYIFFQWFSHFSLKIKIERPKHEKKIYRLGRKLMVAGIFGKNALICLILILFFNFLFNNKLKFLYKISELKRIFYDTLNMKIIQIKKNQYT